MATSRNYGLDLTNHNIVPSTAPSSHGAVTSGISSTPAAQPAPVVRSMTSPNLIKTVAHQTTGLVLITANQSANLALDIATRLLPEATTAAAASLPISVSSQVSQPGGGVSNGGGGGSGAVVGSLKGVKKFSSGRLGKKSSQPPMAVPVTSSGRSTSVSIVKVAPSLATGTVDKKKNKISVASSVSGGTAQTALLANSDYSDDNEDAEDNVDGVDQFAGGAVGGSDLPVSSSDKSPGGGAAGGGRGRGGAGGRRRKERGVWEVLEGLRNGSQCSEPPTRYEGFMAKTRKWPLKGWHKRYFLLENGILSYGKSLAEIQKGKIHGAVDVGMSVVACKRKGRRIDVDADDVIYHFKSKSSSEFEVWTSQIRHHRLYRQYLVSLGVAGALGGVGGVLAGAGGAVGGMIGDRDVTDMTRVSDSVNNRIVADYTTPTSTLSSDKNSLSSPVTDTIAGTHGMLKLDSSNKELLIAEERLLELESLLSQLQNHILLSADSRASLLVVNGQTAESTNSRKVIASLSNSKTTLLDSVNGATSLVELSTSDEPARMTANVLRQPAGANEVNDTSNLSSGPPSVSPPSSISSLQPPSTTPSTAISTVTSTSSTTTSMVGGGGKQVPPSPPISQTPPSPSKSGHQKKDKSTTAPKKSFRMITSRKSKISFNAGTNSRGGLLTVQNSPRLIMSSSNPDLSTLTTSPTNDLQRAINSTDNVDVDSTLRLCTQIYACTKTVHDSLKSVSRMLGDEMRALAKSRDLTTDPSAATPVQLSPTSSGPTSATHHQTTSSGPAATAAYVQSLKLCLAEAVDQNAELVSRLSLIHSKSSIAGLKPILPSVLNSPPSVANYNISANYGGPSSSTINRTPRSRSSSGDSRSYAGLQFFDAEEHLNSSSSSDDEEDDEDDDELSDADDCIPAVGNNVQPPISRFTKRRRSRLPSPKIDADIGLWSLLRKNIGKDLSKISMPVSLNEPLNTLQRLCEELEYSELVDRAAETADPITRMVLIAAFSVSAYSSMVSRCGQKPFNPVLGETFECIREDKGWKYVSEQVSHHPPISACHCISDNFIYWQEAQAKTKFWGKSLEIIPLGTVHLKLIRYSNEHYSWNKATTCVHNILGGGSQRWVEQYGDVLLTNHTLGITCKFTYSKSSYTSSKKDEVYGTVYDADNNPVHHLFGKWSEALYCGDSQSSKCIWRQGSMPPEHELYYGFTRFAIELNELDQSEAPLLPHTDTRFRPDQRLLEEGKLEEAEIEKKRVEDLQRERRVEASATQGKLHRDSVIATPARWFNKNGEHYEFNGQYWTTRANKGFSKLYLPILW